MLVKGLGTDPSKRWFLNLLQKYQTDELDGLKENFKLIKNFTKVQKSKLVALRNRYFNEWIVHTLNRRFIISVITFFRFYLPYLKTDT